MMRDTELRLTYCQPRPTDTCGWCGSSLGALHAAPCSDAGLAFCSARCATAHEIAALRLDAFRARLEVEA